MMSVFTSGKKTDNFPETGLPVFDSKSNLYVSLCPETPKDEFYGLLKINPETLKSVRFLEIKL